jgi:hypothetical protein
MNKVILICGKRCSGKKKKEKKIANDINEVILTVDEITLALFGQYIGDKHDEKVKKTEKYLYKKTVELISKYFSVNKNRKSQGSSFLMPILYLLLICSWLGYNSP